MRKILVFIYRIIILVPCFLLSLIIRFKDCKRQIHSAYLVKRREYEIRTFGLIRENEIITTKIIQIINWENIPVNVKVIYTNFNMAMFGGAACQDASITDRNINRISYQVIINPDDCNGHVENFLAHELGHLRAGRSGKSTWWCLDELDILHSSLRIKDELAADRVAIMAGIKITPVFNLFNFLQTPIAVAVRYFAAKKLEKQQGL